MSYMVANVSGGYACFTVIGADSVVCAVGSIRCVGWMLCLCGCCVCGCFFFFQAEDGIRDHCVTGVQTCALPIW